MRRLVVAVIGLFQRLPYSPLGLLARLAIGLVFWNSGRTKVDGWNILQVSDKTALLFRKHFQLWW